MGQLGSQNHRVPSADNFFHNSLSSLSSCLVFIIGGREEVFESRAEACSTLVPGPIPALEGSANASRQILLA